MDCHALLIAWNLFKDVVTTLHIEFFRNKQDNVSDKIYDKLFFGTNIPAITPEGKEYIPQWTKAE